jgi:asparagine synthase (glutamine-hydrolysing)
MKPRILLTFANPGARVVRREHALWIASGLDEQAVTSLGPEGDSRSGVEAALCRRYGDASIVRVDLSRGTAARIAAWKGLTAGYDVFYRAGPGRQVVVADHFRNILSEVPVAERAPADEVLCDHFLFRTVPGENTLCRSVKRLGRGETLLIDLRSGSLRKERFDHVEGVPRPGRLSDYLARIDAALESVLEPCRGTPDAATLFSGGVDSTLIQTYLGSSVPAICYELPFYAEGFEAPYARRAADLLGIELEQHGVDLADYLKLLEGAIDAAAMPPPHLQLALYQSLMGLNRKWLIVGEQADALFGIELRRARLAAPFASAAGCAVLKVAASLPSGRAHRLRRIRDAAGRLAQPPYSLDGYGALFGTYTDWPLLEAMFGQRQVRERLQARLDVACALQQTAAPRSRFYRHVELAQMVDYLCEDIMMCFRHLAHAFGRTLTSPFTTRALLDTALSIPAEHRYLSRLESKHLLKRLLQRRLPAYPVNQQKGYMHLPFADMYRHGPLSPVWRHYAVPDIFEGEHRDRLIETPTQMTWNAITLAIWQDRVQKNPNLQAVPGSRSFIWELLGPVAVHSDV